MHNYSDDPRFPHERPPGSRRNGSLVFWLLSPIWGLALAFLLAPLGTGPSSAALFIAIGGTLGGAAMLESRPEGNRASRFLIAMVYLGAAAFVLFFGGWGVGMMARGGG